MKEEQIMCYNIPADLQKINQGFIKQHKTFGTLKRSNLLNITHSNFRKLVKRLAVKRV